MSQSNGCLNDLECVRLIHGDKDYTIMFARGPLPGMKLPIAFVPGRPLRADAKLPLRTGEVAANDTRPLKLEAGL